MRNNELIAYMEREFQGDSPQIAKLKAANVFLQRIADGTDPYQSTDGIEQIPDELRQTSMPETGQNSLPTQITMDYYLRPSLPNSSRKQLTHRKNYGSRLMPTYEYSVVSVIINLNLSVG